ncbi:MAG: IS110 family transposase, partial [Candidatus Omnitrophota bacterium]
MLSSEKGLHKVLALNLDSVYMFELKIIVGQIKNLNQVIEEISKELTERGKKVDGHKNLTSIKGIG